MFDDLKKELERLEQQLLAAEMDEEDMADETESEEFDSIYEDVYDEFGREEPYEMDDELMEMMGCAEVPIRNHANNYGRAERSVSSRSAGFDADEEDYYMDSDRYVPAPQKKGIGGLVFFALTLALSAIALALWWLGRLL